MFFQQSPKSVLIRNSHDLDVTWLWPGCDLDVTWLWPGYVSVQTHVCVCIEYFKMFFIHAEVRSCISGESFRNMWISWLRLDFAAWAHQRLWTSTVCSIAKPATMWNKHYHSFDFKQPASRNWRHNKQVTTADFEQPPWSILNFRFCCHWFDVPLRPSPLISMLRRQLCFILFCALYSGHVPTQHWIQGEGRGEKSKVKYWP